MASPSSPGVPSVDLEARIDLFLQGTGCSRNPPCPWTDRDDALCAHCEGRDLVQRLRALASSQENVEIEADPSDISEWIDVVILALDGAWRAGYQPQQIIDALVAKQTKNEGRDWPDWRTAATNKATILPRALKTRERSTARGGSNGDGAEDVAQVVQRLRAQGCRR